MTTHLETKVVVLGKDRHCFGCNRTFLKGNRMTKNTGVDDGQFHHTYWCDVCDAYYQEYMYNEDEIYEGELKDCDAEMWEEMRAEMEDTL